MEAIEAILKRRSIRNYSSQPIDEKILIELIDAAANAPSAHNSQNWHFILIRNNTVQKQLMLNNPERGMLVSAPVVVACCFKNEADPWSSTNIALAAENLVIAASSHGVGSCIVSPYIFDKEKQDSYKELKDLLEIPEDMEILFFISLGYNAEKLTEKEIKPISELISYDKYNRISYIEL